jgi:hypothetical protein
MENETNIAANVSLGTGVAALVCLVIHWCIGCIPVLGLFAAVLFPIEILCAGTAIISGGFGIKMAGELEGGTGKPQAITGMVLGLLYFLILGSILVLALMFGFGIVILENLIIFAVV